jgi:DNA invertase Pin-like site-specific DNA recombinase
MLGAIAQFETEIRAERKMDGIKKAKERGDDQNINEGLQHPKSKHLPLSRS